MFRFIAAILTLCVLAILVAPFAYRYIGPGDRAERLLEDGRLRAAEGNWIEARLRFEEILARAPENLQARLGLARALRDGGLYEPAATHLLHIIDRAPDMAEARIEFGEMLFLAGEMEESQTQLAAALRVGGETPRADALAAAHAAAGGDDAGARELAETALAADPTLSPAYATLAALSLRQEDFIAAIAVLDRARAAGAETLSLGLLRLGIYEKTGREDEIGAELTALGERYPETPELRIALARWLLDNRPADAGEARDILGGLLRESAEDPAMTIDLTGQMIDLLGIEGTRGVFDAAAADPALEGVFENEIAALENAAGDRDAAVARLEREIAGGGSVERRNVSRLILARLLDPVEERARRVELAAAVLETDPENPSAHLMLADADLRGGGYESAISHLRSALSSQPDSTDIILELARAHSLAGSAELAQDRLSKAVQTSGQDPEIVLRYARLIESRQGLRPAAELIDIALEAHPGDVGLLVRRAQLALSLGDVDTARALRARLSTLEGSEDVVASLDMAITAQFGGAEDVITALEEAWTTSRDEAGLLSLGAAHLRSGNAARALELLDGALAERPDWNAARLMRADAHMAAGTFEAAEADLAAVATATPGDAVVQANLARLRLALGRVEAADAAIAEGLSHAPEDYELQVLQARRLETTGDVEAARAALERLAQRQPGDPRVAQRLGLLLTAPGRPPEDIRQALQVTAAFDAASDPALQEIRGWVLHRGGDDARAAAMLRDAATGRPDDPVVQARLGLAELGTGDVEQARAVLSRALDLAAQADAETDGGGSDVLAMARDALDGLSESARSTQSN